MTALEGQRLVALVGDEPEPVLDGQPRHRLERRAREDGARRVVRAVEHDQLRAWCDRVAHARGIQIEARRLAVLDGHRHRVQQSRLLGIRDPERARHDHLVAGIQ